MRESDYSIKANRQRSILITAILVMLALGSVGLYLIARDPFSEREIHRLIEESYRGQRPGGGRLYSAGYFSATDAGSVRPDLGKAQVLLLSFPESATKQRLQGQIYVAAGNWQKYIETATHLPPALHRDPEVLNNLGASYLALGEKNPSNLLKALDQFEQASQLNPKAPDPLFNLVVTYRQLRLHRLAEAALARYASLDSDSPWHHELTNRDTTAKSALIDELKAAVDADNRSEAERIFGKDPDLFRRYARQYASSETDESPAVLQFIGVEMARRYNDNSISAMIAPLLRTNRDVALALRQFVIEGAGLLVQGNIPDSLRAYAKAEELLPQMDSIFDRLWIDLNRADTEIQGGQFEAARKSLERVLSGSRKSGFIWLEAKALSIYGSTLKLTSSYSEMMKLLEEADRIFTNVQAPHDRVRVLYYLAFYRYGAGDGDEALRLALKCLQLDDEDSQRKPTLDWLIGSILYRLGMADRAVLFEQESLEQSKKTQNWGMEAVIASTLAELEESMSQPKLADQYIKAAEEALTKMPPSFHESGTDEVRLGTVKARIDLNRKQYAKAESQLEQNLEIYARQPFPATDQLSQSLMLLAKVYSETGRREKAEQKFNEAIDVVENDDHYLQSEKLRIKFDDQRRELYDSAIEFAYQTGSIDAAWTYLQKYRAKLFIEFLAQFDTNVGQVHAEALNRSKVQKLIPADTQIIEYALLKDRLLIWFVSRNVFTLRSVTVSRGDIEAKVEDVLQRLRNHSDVDALLTDLGKSLIEPVVDLLESGGPDRTVVVIPDRALHGLPFEALRLAGRHEYLVQQFPVMVSPNLTHLLLTNAMEPSRDGITGFGSQNGDSSEMRELNALSNIYPKSRMFGGREVDKTRFLSAMSKAAVFHYAGHSATDAVDPLRSSILLDGNRSGPNSVTAVDIAQQRLANNAVVVLSSCDSSVGNSRDGIGVRGLTSAFLIGGAGSVVGSLWPVEASSTADLMIRFHRAFANSRMSVAKALREAQLSFLRSFPERVHPYYWSGFVVTGNFTALR